MGCLVRCSAVKTSFSDQGVGSWMDHKKAGRKNELELLEEFLNARYPGRSFHDIEFLDRVTLDGGDESHLMFNADGSDLDLWLPGGGPETLQDLEIDTIKDLIFSQVDRFRNGDEFKTDNGKLLRFQRFGKWEDEVGVDIPLSSIDLLRENGTLRVRLDTGKDRYILEIDNLGSRGPSGTYIMSRLNSVGCSGVPSLLGMSYWDLDRSPVPWLRFIKMPHTRGSGFRPFLSDLSKLIDGFDGLSTNASRNYIVDLARRGDLGSMMIGRSYGATIGEIHGKIMLDNVIKHDPDGMVKNQIIDLFDPTSFNTTAVGSLLGISSYYINELKKDFVKFLGDRERINPQSGRKMRVLRHERSRIEGIDVVSLSLLRESFLKREGSIRSMVAGLRKFSGAPMTPTGLDTRLDRVEQAEDGTLTIGHFDWSFFNADREGLVKFLPLKDLALALNSLSKARYLASRKYLKKASREADLDERQLVTLYIEYSLAKPDYSSIMMDFNLFQALGERDIPFRKVFSASVISTLWYERVRNALITGYSEKLIEMGRSDLLDYPRKADTLEGIKAISCVLGLSEALRALSRGRVSSALGLESDLLNALMIKDQA